MFWKQQEIQPYLTLHCSQMPPSRQEKNEALRTSRKRVFGVPLPPELRILQGVPHTQHRRQLWPRPHRQVEIPLDSRHKMQDLRRDAIQHGAGEVSGRLLSTVNVFKPMGVWVVRSDLGGPRARAVLRPQLPWSWTPGAGEVSGHLNEARSSLHQCRQARRKASRSRWTENTRSDTTSNI